MKREKRILSLALAIFMLFAYLPVTVQAEQSAEFIDGIDGLSAMPDVVVVSPSGTDYGIRVDCEIITPGRSDYTSSQDVVVKFLLNKPCELKVSFGYKLCSGSARYGGHFEGASGTVSFEAGETEKEVSIDVLELINNSVEFGTASDPDENSGAETGYFTYATAIFKMRCG